MPPSHTNIVHLDITRQSLRSTQTRGQPGQVKKVVTPATVFIKSAILSTLSDNEQVT